MNVFTANPLMYVFTAVAIGAIGLYAIYAVFDRVGLPVETARAVVVDKQYTKGGTTYNTEVAGNRTWVMPTEGADYYGVVLTVKGETTSTLVSKAQFDAIAPGDDVAVRTQRTRVTRRLLVVDVARSKE